MIVLYILGYFYRNKQNSYAALSIQIARLETKMVVGLAAIEWVRWCSNELFCAGLRSSADADLSSIQGLYCSDMPRDTLLSFISVIAYRW